MKVVVITSGGLDSHVLMHWHIRNGDQVRALSVDYGQRHRRELIFACNNALDSRIPYENADLQNLARILPGSSQTDVNVKVPKGHYSEESMKATVVPNRNMILLAVAIGHAIAHKFEAVSYAAHSGDHAIYPDCREEFASAMAQVSLQCDWTPITLLRPFIQRSKADIVRLGNSMAVNFRNTWSCYSGEDLHCGACGTCTERREAFYLAGVEDPTHYHPSAPLLADLVRFEFKLPT